jgi:hypothetical protein
MFRFRMNRRSLWLRVAVCAMIAVVALAQTGHTAKYGPPTPMGVSGGNSKDSSSRYCCSGTLGALVANSQYQYVLSNNHVLARTNKAALGENIIQPGLTDLRCDPSQGNVVAGLSAFKPIDFARGKTNTVDAAIAKVASGMVSGSGTILDIGTISSTIATPSAGMAVKKSGRTTGLTAGTISYLNVSVRVGYNTSCGVGNQTAQFVGQIGITSRSTFSAGGDSGSLIVTSSTPPQPVGLLFAGSNTLTLANPISAVLAAFPSIVVGFVGATSATASPTLFTAPTVPGLHGRSDSGLEKASRIKERYSDFLDGLPESVGHATGLSKTGSGEPVIHLFVRQASDLAKRVPPSHLEGVKVEIVETGEFQALPGCAEKAAPCGGCRQ